MSADASPELWAKYLSLLKEVVPRLSRVGVVGQVASQVGFAELEKASRKLGLTLEVTDLRSPNDFDGAFPALIDKRVGGISVVVGPLTYLLRQQIADAAIKYHLPSISNAKQFAQAGLLMSYGPNLDDLYRQAASYVDKILRGAAPADPDPPRTFRYRSHETPLNEDDPTHLLAGAVGREALAA